MDHGVSWYASESVFALLAFVPIIIYLVLIVLSIFLVIKVIKFMNQKLKLDNERNEKLDELIKSFKGSQKIE
jgi:large-conductance mechanosensitive channel